MITRLKALLTETCTKLHLRTQSSDFTYGYITGVVLTAAVCALLVLANIL